MFYVLILLLCFCSFYSMESLKENDKSQKVFSVLFLDHPEIQNPVANDKETNILRFFFNDKLKLNFQDVQGETLKAKRESYEVFVDKIWQINTNSLIGGLAAHNIADYKNQMHIERFALKEKFRGTIDCFGKIAMHVFLTNLFMENEDLKINLEALDKKEGQLINYYCSNYGFFQDGQSCSPSFLCLTRSAYIECLKSKAIILDVQFAQNSLYLKDFMKFLEDNKIPFKKQFLKFPKDIIQS